MQVRELTEDLVVEIKKRLRQAKLPNLFNSYRGMVGWIDFRPLQVLDTGTCLFVFGVGITIDVMQPLGNTSREEVQHVVAFLQQTFPGKAIWFSGLTDDDVELFNKTYLEEIHPSYVLRINNILSQESKKLRNAISKIEKNPPQQKALTQETAQDAQAFLTAWSAAQEDANTLFQENILREFPQTQGEEYHGAISYIDDKPVGLYYLARGQAHQAYTSMLINMSLKEINGLSEYQIWQAAQYAKNNWECEFINYGGADPKTDPGLHAYKKRFGWDHVLIEYAVVYPANE